ncbi:hypothetical protein SNEBB_009426 [Seison nebaliae]|nr:hypothetical protein SNEBB_009426 [Seison nebaliae]
MKNSTIKFVNETATFSATQVKTILGTNRILLFFVILLSVLLILTWLVNVILIYFCQFTTKTKSSRPITKFELTDDEDDDEDEGNHQHFDRHPLLSSLRATVRRLRKTKKDPDKIYVKRKHRKKFEEEFAKNEQLINNKKNNSKMNEENCKRIGEIEKIPLTTEKQEDVEKLKFENLVLERSFMRDKTQLEAKLDNGIITTKAIQSNESLNGSQKSSSKEELEKDDDNLGTLKSFEEYRRSSNPILQNLMRSHDNLKFVQNRLRSDHQQRQKEEEENRERKKLLKEENEENKSLSQSIVETEKFKIFERLEDQPMLPREDGSSKANLYMSYFEENPDAPKERAPLRSKVLSMKSLNSTMSQSEMSIKSEESCY